MNKKSGISLIVLAITITVVLILTVVTIVAFDSNIHNTSIATFVNDLKEVEDSFESTAIDSGISGITTKTKQEILALVGNENSIEFEHELELNNDDTETVFYVVNLKNIGILKSKRGNKKDSDEADIYVIAKSKMHAYYLKGIEVNDTFYFSISSKIEK